MAEPRIVTFDLMIDDPDYYFVLTTALGDFAAQARAEAKDGTNPESNTRWAETAEDAIYRIETALARTPAMADDLTTAKEKPPGCDPERASALSPVPHDYEAAGEDYGSLADGGSYERLRCRNCGRIAYSQLPD